tara:strand:+ start:15516 stop:16145 length:630 start_codon:yes stop_codon:yes gene_type:complete
MINSKNKNNLKKLKLKKRRTLKRKGAGKLKKVPTMQSLKKATVSKSTRSNTSSPSFSDFGDISRSSSRSTNASPASLGRISPASSIGNLSFSEILSLNEMEPIQSPVISDQQKQKKSKKKIKKTFKPIVDSSEDILLSQMNSINLQGPPMIPKIEPIRPTPTPSVHNLSSIFSHGDDNKSEEDYKSDDAVGQRSRNTSFDSFTDGAVNF